MRELESVVDFSCEEYAEKTEALGKQSYSGIISYEERGLEYTADA